MKIKLLMVMIIFISSYSFSCPTCVGTIHHDSPPFFADEFYQPQEQLNEFDALVTGSGF